jgi:hypothetical protein
VTLLIDQPGSDRCPLCGSAVEKSGYTVEDDQHVRKFLCLDHVQRLLGVMLMPLRTIGREA